MPPRNQETPQAISKFYRRLESTSPRVNQLFQFGLSKIFDAYVALKLQGFEIEGAQNLPGNGSYIIAPNHTSHLDTAVIGQAMRDAAGRPMRYMAKAGFWTEDWGALKGRFVERGGGFPIVRNNGLGLENQPDARVTLDTIFDRGQILAIYPQGTRRPRQIKDGQRIDAPLELKQGVSKIAMRYSVPIVPVGIAGVEDQDYLAVTFGEPIMPPIENELLTTALTAQLATSIEAQRTKANQLRIAGLNL